MVAREVTRAELEFMLERSLAAEAQIARLETLVEGLVALVAEGEARENSYMRRLAEVVNEIQAYQSRDLALEEVQ